MNIYQIFTDQLQTALNALTAAGTFPEGTDFSRAAIETPKDESHGDLATNAAMVLSKPAKMKPRDLAELIAAQMRDWPQVEAVEIAGPGFINIRLKTGVWHDLVHAILAAPDTYGSVATGKGTTVNVEYVSTNPTGPLHIGHVRGAVIGDVLASVMAKAGYDVVREYYVNDAGAQVDVLARTAHLRYREALGETIKIPDGWYPGDYLVPVGAALKEKFGDQYQQSDEAEWLPLFRDFALNAMLDLIRADLGALGIVQQFSSERALVEAGTVQQMIEELQAKDIVYTGTLPPPKGKEDTDWEPREQLLMRTSAYGDEEDNALVKSDGTFTYFATDVAYHHDKMKRGGDLMIDIWGADHHGHVQRMDSAIRAVSGTTSAPFNVILCSLVKLMRGGQEVKMSKRAGNIVTLRQLLSETGPDVVRFMMLTRRHTEKLNFDLEKAVEKSLDNPLYYVQYAHARTCSVLRQAGEVFGKAEGSAGSVFKGPDAEADLSALTRPEELTLAAKLALWPRVIETAAAAQEPHRVTFYLMDVAAAFHSLWSAGRGEAQLRFIVEDDLKLTTARLALVEAAKIVIGSGLNVMGVEAAQEM